MQISILMKYLIFNYHYAKFTKCSSISPPNQVPFAQMF